MRLYILLRFHVFVLLMFHAFMPFCTIDVTGCFSDRASIVNGYYEALDASTVIKAHCHNGYRLVGSEIRQCNSDERRYTGTPPICVGKVYRGRRISEGGGGSLCLILGGHHWGGGGDWSFCMAIFIYKGDGNLYFFHCRIGCSEKYIAGG